MRSQLTQSGSQDQDFANEALSSEVLKLKIDDLFQEVERLKQRVERLEYGIGSAGVHHSGKGVAAPTVVSDPDCR